MGTEVLERRFAAIGVPVKVIRMTPSAHRGSSAMRHFAFLD